MLIFSYLIVFNLFMAMPKNAKIERGGGAQIAKKINIFFFAASITTFLVYLCILLWSLREYSVARIFFN